MPRIARVVIPDCPHHITQRGNRSEAIFFSPADRERYLGLLSKYSEKHGLAIQAYCLMTNHVHLVAVPREADSLAKALKPVAMRYAQHVNAAQGFCGRLWQGRFFSCPLDDDHLWAAVRYVELNPVRAGMVDRAEAYRWSSAAGHMGLWSDPLLSDPCALREQMNPAEWGNWLAEENEHHKQDILRLRQCTKTGRPAGGDAFITMLEKTMGRALVANPVGRPKCSN